MEFLSKLFTNSFMPHGHCFFWRPDILWLHVASDLLIALAYFSIPAALIYFVRRRKDLVFDWIFVMFGIFIFACGATHVMDVWNIWRADYGIEGLVKAATAVASVATSIMLWPLIPKALAIPSPAELRKTNERLVKEIGDREAAEKQFRELNAELEIKVRERTAEIQRSNNELERFAYIASHDLQEPLRTVRSFCDLLARSRGTSDPNADTYINFIHDGVGHMHALIESLLTYSRSSKKESPIAAVDMGEVLAKTKRSLEAAISENAAIISNGNLPQVRGNETQLTMLLQNLIANGIKYKRNNPPNIKVGAEDAGHFWRFYVSDDGIGIEETYFVRIFDLFERLHPRDKYPGTGMGLAICKKIVEGHGGRIWVKSTPGQGSTFYFDLPKSA